VVDYIIAERVSRSRVKNGDGHIKVTGKGSPIFAKMVGFFTRELRHKKGVCSGETMLHVSSIIYNAIIHNVIFAPVQCNHEREQQSLFVTCAT